MSRAKHILVVEDDPGVADFLSQLLEAEGFHVATAGDGEKALQQVMNSPPDLLMLDWLLPRLPGLDVCRLIRQDQRLRNLPIMILTGRTSETDRIVGLEIGADDYVTKPFSSGELVARVRALLRRAEGHHGREETIEVGALVIDPNLCEVTRNGKLLALTALEFRLLHFLAKHPNKVFSREDLLAMVWGRERNVTSRSVDTYFWRLREKLGPDEDGGGLLRNVRGRGYLLRTASATGAEQIEKPYAVKSRKLG